MTTATVPSQHTPEEIARLSDLDGKLYELIGGNLVEKIQLSKTSNWIAGQISFLLKTVYPTSRAYVFPEQPTYCFPDPREMRRPDVALVWSQRLPKGLDDDELHIAPDLVVEIVSPTNTFDDQLNRVAQYLRAGVSMIWVVHPALRWVHIYRRGGPYSVLHEDETFMNDALLPGLTMAANDIFPPATAESVEK